MNRSMRIGSLIAVLIAAPVGTALAGAFVLSSGANPDRFAHPTPYVGTGGILDVSVCIHPSSESIAEMQVSLENSIYIWNQFDPVSPNLFLGGSNNIPSDAIDFESTLTHEIGHCIGLAHPNVATESGLPAADRDYTKSAEGPNGVWNLSAGSDGIKGSADDIRGDDINLHWFVIDQNNPFVAGPVFDATVYSRNLADLPVGHTFAANADRTVGASLGIPDSEAVMQQGAFFDEDQRQLAVDDVATLRLAMSGLDRTQGTSDDYVPRLVYGGVATGCHITVRVTGSSFAFCSFNGQAINGNNNHLRVTNANVQLGSASNFNWFFNNVRIDPSFIFGDGFEAVP